MNPQRALFPRHPLLPRRSVTASAAVLLALATAACIAPSDDDEATGTVASGKIIGENDLVSVIQNGANIPAKYRPLLDAFGRISMGCTATHIGDGLVLTAGHCFNASSTRADNRPCDGKSVAWGFRKDSPAYLTSNCTTILTMQHHRDRDFAIFRVDRPPPVKVRMRYDARPPVDTKLTIFSHPRSRPLEWSTTCLLKPGSVGGWGADMLSHQCDTEGGSSGAAVIDDDTLEIVAIHDGGRVPWNYATYLESTPIEELVGPSGNEWPVVSLGLPATGATVRGTVEVTAVASDSDGAIERVSFELPDGSVVDTTIEPYSVTWDTTKNGDGPRTIKVTAFDDVGGKSSTTRVVNVDNGLPPWSASSEPALSIVDNGTTCTDVEVTGPGWAMDAKFDLAGNHAHRYGLRATLTHGTETQTVVELRSLGYGSGNFNVTSRPAPGFTGKAAGTWRLCVDDTDTRVGTGIIAKFAVHD